MFKNREIRIKLAKNKDAQNINTLQEVLDNPDSVALIEETGRRFVKHLALTVLGVAVAIMVVDDLGEIAVKLTPTK